MYMQDEIFKKEIFEKIDTVNETLSLKIDAVNQALSVKIDAVNEALSERVDTLVEAIQTLATQNDQRFDRLENLALDTRDDVAIVKVRVSNLERQHEQTFKRVDDFLVLVNRHESEIAASRSAYDRLDKRVTGVEKKTA